MIIYERLFHAIAMIMLVGICAVYAGAFYWNMKYIRLIKNNLYSQRIHVAIACGLVFLSYGYVLTTYVTTNPLQYSLIAGLLLRPVLFYLGCTLVAVAKRRYYIAKKDISVLKRIEKTIEGVSDGRPK